MPGEGGFTTTEEDLVAANRLHARQLWNRRAVLRGWLLFTVALALVAFGLCGLVGWTLLWVPIGAAVFMAIGAIVSLLTFSRAGRQHYRQAQAFWRPVTLEWDNDSVRFTSDRGEGRYKWADFFSWAADDRSILLYQSANCFFTIPTKDLNEEAKIEIASALREAGVAERSSR